MSGDAWIGPWGALLGTVSPDNGPSTPREIAELIWLAQNLPEGTTCRSLGTDNEPLSSRDMPTAGADAVDADPPAGEAPTPDRTETPLYLPDHEGPSRGSERIHASAVRVTGAVALPRRRALARALRPLKRSVPAPTRTVLDEDATANLIADTGRWMPVLVPAQIRWLDVLLVIDAHGRDATLWEPLGRGLQAVLQETGAFRDARTQWLRRDELGRPTLGGRTRRHHLHTPAAALDPTHRTVTLLLTDGVDPAWQGPVLQGILRRWAASGPTAILQALPERLWRQTALVPEPGRFHSTEAGASNSLLKYTPYALQARPLQRGEITIPVLGIEPEWLAPWVRSIAGRESFDGAAVRLPASAPLLAVDRESAPAAPHREIGFEDFLAQAHPRVFRLAAYLAVPAPLNLGLMRLIQSTMLPDSPASELAEIVFSGLLRRRSDTDSTDAQQQAYEFAPRVRQRLRSTLRRDETHAVVTAVSAYVDRASPATSARFTAAVADPGGSLSIAAGAQHWAAVRRLARAPSDEVPTRGVGETSRRFLITIGMSAYTDSSLPDLPSVPADINRVSEAFKRVGYLHVLPHLARAPAGYKVLQDIAEWSEAELDHRDTIVIYFAGHVELQPALDDESDLILLPNRLRANDILTPLGSRRLNNLVLILDTDWPGWLSQLSQLPITSNFAIMAYGMRHTDRGGSTFARALSDVLTEPRSDDDGDLSFEALYSQTRERLRRYTGGAAARSVETFTGHTYSDTPLITQNRPFVDARPEPRAAAAVFPDQHQTDVIRELVGWMREPRQDNPLIITGVPGSGKTTLFSLFAEEVARENLGKVVTLNAMGSDVNDLWGDLAEHLGMPGSPAGLVIDEMARSATPLVVIIDDLDRAKSNMIDGILADLVRPLEQMPSVRLVLSSNGSVAPAWRFRSAKVTELNPSRAGNVVVGVHGIGQQLLGQQALLSDWGPALLDGMAHSGRYNQRPPLDVSIGMVFYGDLFRPARSGTTGSETLPDDGLAGELLVAWAQAALRRKIPAGTNVLRFLASSRFFGKATTGMVTSDLRQVQAYLTDPAIRAAARQRVMSAISPGTRVVVAHSLGSVVAYEALCALRRHQVRALVTLGSPLGILPVLQRLQPAPRELDGVLRGHWPGGQELKWTNIVDKDDIVASVKDLRISFGDGVRTVLVDNGSRAHDATRYLTNAACGHAVAAGLGA